MIKEYEIIDKVYAAKGNSRAADQLVRQYLPFIKSETAKYIHRIPKEGEDDELNIAMFAFHESVLNYNKTKGAFLSFSAINIRNRLIDYYRKEKRHLKVLSLNYDETENIRKTLLNQIDITKNELDEIDNHSFAKEEIEEFAKQLKDFGLELTDIADNCPKQDRTLDACHKALSFAKENPTLLNVLLRSKKLPISELSEGSGVKLKTLERHRKYMVAIMLAYTNGFEIIRGHLRQIATKKGDS